MRRFTIRTALAVLVLPAVLHAQEKDVSGNWQGTIEPGTRIVIKTSKSDGIWKGVLFYVDEGQRPTPVAITLQDTTVKFSVKLPDLTYTGTLNSAGESITGIATSNGQPHRLILHRVSAEDTWPTAEVPKPMPADAKPRFEVVTIKLSDPNHPGKGFDFHGRHMMTFNTNVNDLIAFCLRASCESGQRRSGVATHRFL